jgi:hypothetical protein
MGICKDSKNKSLNLRIDMKTFRSLIIVIIIVLIGYSTYFFFIDSLSFSQLTGNSNNSTAAILVNLLDFDTGLTRFDVYRLQKKTTVWERRKKHIYSIQDPALRKKEHDKLIAEMMQDPGFKKIARKLFGFGARGAFETAKIVSGFSLLW